MFPISPQLYPQAIVCISSHIHPQSCSSACFPWVSTTDILVKDRNSRTGSHFGFPAMAVICVWRIIFESQTLWSAVTDTKLEDKSVKKEGRLPGDGDRQQSTNYLPCQWKITYTCMLRGSQMWSPAETERGANSTLSAMWAFNEPRHFMWHEGGEL